MSQAASAYQPHSWETVNCPFCDQNNFSVYEKFGSELQYTYVLCKSCSLVYENPRPAYNQHFIDAAYGSYYQFDEATELNDDTNISESSVALFKKEVAQLLRFDTQRSAVLDIGSSMGTFLYAVKPHYQTAVGLDMSEQLAGFVERKLGVKVFIQQFDRFDPGYRFSLIHMSHVLEHIPNPNDWMVKAKQLLADGGILTINIPNKFALNYRFKHLLYKLGLKQQFSSAWKDASRTPDHLFEPTIPAMKYLLKKHNYKILDYYTYSRKDPASNGSLMSRMMNRVFKTGSNLTFIVTPA